MAARGAYYSALVSVESTVGRRASRRRSPPPAPRRRLALNTAIFALATALSRIAGLGREVVQASFFGTTSAASAFTLASQVPNLFSNLFSQAALSAAFVPVFTELLQQGRKREAFRLASSLFWLILIVLGALTVVWIGGRGPGHAAVHRHASARRRRSLTVGLSRVLFPVVLLLSLTGLLVGILQSYDQFTIPALAPGGLEPRDPRRCWSSCTRRFHGQNAVYAYAIAWLVATVVQLLLIAWAMRQDRLPALVRHRLARPAACAQVLILFLPVTLSIGIINLDVFINAGLGALVSRHAPAAINDAFRIYMLPQGIFSVAVATVLFPTLSRLAIRRDVGGHAPHARQRHPPDQPAADPVGGADGGAGDADHPARLPARGSSPRTRPHLVSDGAVLVRVQPAVRGRQPAARAGRSSRSSGRGSRPSWRR